MESDGVDPPGFRRVGSNRVERVAFEGPASEDGQGCVWINGAQCFEGVGTGTWEFGIGGYRPAAKWLEDRKGRALSFDDIDHYRRVCAALNQTERIIVWIDEAIVAQGGWPLARRG